MRTIQQLYDDFNMEFSNFPIAFEDEITGDGLVTSFQLTFYPILDHASYPPLVYINTGTFAAPFWDLKSEGVDYRLNYETGQLDFLTGAPPEILDTDGEPVGSARIQAHHCKINLKQFISFYNQERQSMSIFFPRRSFEEIPSATLGLQDSDRLTDIDLTTAPWNEWYKIEQFFQNRDDRKHVPFMLKDNIIIFDRNNNDDDLKYVLGPSDYYRGPFKTTQSILTPFYIKGIKLYPYFEVSGINPNTYLGEETYLNYDNGAARNLILRIAYDMYKMREHWSERMNAATLRMSTLKDVQAAKMSVQQELLRHSAENAPGRGTTPPITGTN